jgi:lipoprotein-anchoring transpeptidase ErfK/SrfK
MTKRTSRIFAVLAGLISLSGRSAAQERRIIVSIPDRQLAVIENGQTIRKFSIAVGSAKSPSPTGEFRVVSRLKDPTYYHPGVVIPAGPNNPIGPRWMGLNKTGYGIHGTNEPSSIGKAASHGCIRLSNKNVKELFQMVRVGDVVEIDGERDEEVAALFDAPVQPTELIAAFGAGQ